MEKRSLNKNIDLLLRGFTELKDNGRFNEPNLDGSAGDYISFSSWEWPQGVGLFGLVRLWENTKSDELYQIIDQWFQGNIEKGLQASTSIPPRRCFPSRFSGPITGSRTTSRCWITGQIA